MFLQRRVERIGAMCRRSRRRPKPRRADEAEAAPSKSRPPVSAEVPLFLWLASGVSVALSLLPILAAARFGSYVRGARGRNSALRSRPVASVILPVQRARPGIRENIRSILDQNYPDSKSFCDRN